MTPTPPPAPPSPDPPATTYRPPDRPPLRRSRTNKVLGGVSGGLAEYSGIDPLLWRIGFVALALAGPGVPVYLLLWIFMPAEHTAGEPRASRPAGPRSPVPGLTLAGLLIVVGLLAALTRFTGWDVGPVGFFGSALLVVGLGLVAAAFTGGRRAKGGLIALGTVLSLALLVSAAQPWEDVEGDVGDRTYHPRTATDVQPVYSLGLGDTTLDLSDLSDLDQPVTTQVNGGLGDVDVLVPRSADVRVDVHSGLGEVDVLDLASDGGLSLGSGAAWSGDGEPDIVLTINAGIGDVEVDRA